MTKMNLTFEFDSENQGDTQFAANLLPLLGALVGGARVQQDLGPAPTQTAPTEGAKSEPVTDLKKAATKKAASKKAATKKPAVKAAAKEKEATEKAVNDMTLDELAVWSELEAQADEPRLDVVNCKVYFKRFSDEHGKPIIRKLLEELGIDKTKVAEMTQEERNAVSVAFAKYHKQNSHGADEDF